MTRYERESAAHRIDGYYAPPQEIADVEAEFIRAKQEAVAHMRAAADQAESMTLTEFLAARRGANMGRRALARNDVLDLLPDRQDGWSAVDYGEWVARAVERAHGIFMHNVKLTGCRRQSGEARC